MNTNSEQFEGRWDRVKGQLRQQWGDLTDDELEQAKGNREELIGKIKQKYGDTKESIGEKVDQIMAKVN